MRIKASVISHPGNCRGNNEDNFCFNGKRLKEDLTPRPIKFSGWTARPFLAAVFDGMGGIAAGEIASRIAAEVACDDLGQLKKTTDMPAFLEGICHRANAQVCDEMRNTVKQRMGTTAAMLLFAGERYHLCNIGDSPIFLFRDGKLTPIFHEHTEKENYILLHGAEAVTPGKKFRLTQHIGIFPEEMQIEPYIVTDTPVKQDRFLICSDGLTDMVSEETVTQILAQGKSAAKTVKLLLEQALQNGGKDNITVICIDIK